MSELILFVDDDGRPKQLGIDCDYAKELRLLQVELIKLQEWVHQEGLRSVVIFEGRDAASRGSAQRESR